MQYWDTGEVPAYLDDLLASFRDRNPEMQPLMFNERTAGEFIAEHFGGRELAAFGACAVPTMQSDFFRYCAVYVLGGVYADVAFRCVAPLRQLLDGVEEVRLFKVEPLGFLLSGFFLFKGPGHPLPRLVLDVMIANIEQRAAERVQMVTGPWILSALSLLHRLGSRAEFQQCVADNGIEPLEEPFRREAPTLVPTPAGRRAVAQMVGPLFEAVGDHTRLTRAFEGVRISPYEEAKECIEECDSPLPYKQSDRYWIKWQRARSIFR